MVMTCIFFWHVEQIAAFYKDIGSRIMVFAIAGIIVFDCYIELYLYVTGVRLVCKSYYAFIFSNWSKILITVVSDDMKELMLYFG